MADGDDLVIGENNQAQSTTQLVLTLNSQPKTLLKVGTGGGASIAVHGIGATGLKGEGGAFGVDGVGGAGGTGVRGTSTSGTGVEGNSTSQEGVSGTSKSGIGVSGSSEDDAGVLGSSDTGIGVRGSVGFSPFPLPAKVGVLGESNAGIAVCAHSFKDTAVRARSVSGKAVHAETDGLLPCVAASAPKAVAVNGEGVYGVRGASNVKSGIGVYGKCSDGYAGYFDGNVMINGNLTKTGIGSAVAVRFPDRSLRQLCSIDSPESWFEDFGEGKLVKGKAEVKIDPDFAKTVNLKTRYHVFVTPHSTKISGLAVVARRPGRFRVEHAGGASGTFSYRIIAKRADIRVRRLERVKMPVTNKIRLG
jgi:hypothetical protein